MQCPECSTTVFAGEKECPFCGHPLGEQPAQEKQPLGKQPAQEERPLAGLAALEKQQPWWAPHREVCPECGSESHSTQEVYLSRGRWSSVRLLHISAAVSITMVVILACVVLLSLSAGSISLASLLVACVVGLRAILFYTSSLKSPRMTRYKCQNCGRKWEGRPFSQ